MTPLIPAPTTATDRIDIESDSVGDGEEGIFEAIMI